MTFVETLFLKIAANICRKKLPYNNYVVLLLLIACKLRSHPPISTIISSVPSRSVTPGPSSSAAILWPSSPASCIVWGYTISSWSFAGPRLWLVTTLAAGTVFVLASAGRSSARGASSWLRAQHHGGHCDGWRHPDPWGPWGLRK